MRFFKNGSNGGDGKFWLDYLMIIWIYTCQALVPWYQNNLDVCFMQQGVMFTEVWQMWFFTGTLIWYHNTQTDTVHSGASRLTHPYKCISTPLVMCSKQLFLWWLNKWLYKWTIQWYQKFTFHNVLSFQKVFTCKLFICWLNAMTNNTARNGASKQNTHTHNTHTHIPNNQKMVN